VNFKFRRRPIEVEGDVATSIFVALPPLNELADAVDPLLHVLAGDRLKEGSQLEQ
jgi:hypothetical protein